MNDAPVLDVTDNSMPNPVTNELVATPVCSIDTFQCFVTDEDTAFVFEQSNDALITLTDVDVDETVPPDNTVQVTLTVNNGTLTLDAAITATITAFDAGADGSATMTFTQTLANVNDALDGLIYTPNLDFNDNLIGGAVLAEQLVITVDDLGHTGATTNLVTTRIIPISVVPVNDAPVIRITDSSTTSDLVASPDCAVETFQCVDTLEDTDFIFSLTNDALLSINDVDVNETGNPPNVPANILEVTLAVSHGGLILADDTGLDFNVSFGGDSDGTDGTIKFRGPQAAVNAAIVDLTYDPDLDHNDNRGAEALVITVNDLGNTGKPAAQTTVRTIPIAVEPDNDTPTISILGASPKMTDEDMDFVFDAPNLLSVDDVDADDNVPRNTTVRVTLEVGHGVLSLSTTQTTAPFFPALDFTPANGNLGDGIDDRKMTFTGLLTDVNAALNNLEYDPDQDFNDNIDAEELLVQVEDLGNIGDVFVNLIANEVIPISVDPVNDAPQIRATDNQPVTTDLSHPPAFSVETDEDVNFVFNQVNDALLSVLDVDVNETATPVHTPTNILEVSLTVLHGALTLSGAGVLDFNAAFSGDSDGSDGTLLFRGSQSDVNAALDGLVYDPTEHFNNNLHAHIMVPDGSGGMVDLGKEALQIVVNDLGNTGKTTSLVTDRYVPISVIPINDAPFVNLTRTATGTEPLADAIIFGFDAPTDEDTGITFDAGGGGLFSIGDVDVDETGIPDNKVEVTLKVSHGLLDFGTFTGLSFTTGDGDDDPEMIFTATLVDVNAALATLTYHPDLNFNDNRGSETLEFKVDDLGHTGLSGNLTESHVISIPVDPVNDVPVIRETDNADLTTDLPATIPFFSPPPTDEDTDLVLSKANDSLLSILDVDEQDGLGNTVRVTLKVSHGVLSLSGISGLNFSQVSDPLHQGNGTNDDSMTFTAPISNANAAIANVTYSPDPDFNDNIDAEELIITVDDLGNTGKVDPTAVVPTVRTVPISVVPVNDAPVIDVTDSASGVTVLTEPATFNVTTDEDQDYIFSQSNDALLGVIDVDVNETATPVHTPTNILKVTLSVTHGELSLAAPADLTS